MTTTKKKAFDLSRDSVYVADPYEDLCILGGKGILPDDESGPLDTVADEDLPLKDLRRLKRALKASFKENIFRRGVNVPVIIVKLDDKAVVVEGKQRVRAARAANIRRDKEGGELPPIRVKCVMQRDSSKLAMIATMISSNNARTDDDVIDKIEKLKAYLEAAGAEDSETLAAAAALFNESVSTLKGWLAFDDRATAETKAAVREGRVGASAAAELARIEDPDEQRAKLATFITAPDKSIRAAKIARGVKASKAGKTRKEDLRAELDFVQKMSHTKHGEKTIAFWEGYENCLKKILGDEDLDERLKALSP